MPLAHTFIAVLIISCPTNEQHLQSSFWLSHFERKYFFFDIHSQPFYQVENSLLFVISETCVQKAKSEAKKLSVFNVRYGNNKKFVDGE